MATVKIDGREVTVEDGTRILDAARSIGIEIPTFCFQARLSGLASCRLCLVEIEGQRKLQPSCVTPVLDGMVINTSTPNVVAARRAMLEFILANHPLDCPICDKGGECELQDMVFTFGPHEGRFGEWKRRFHERDYLLSPVIIKNANRCVQCQRCVRMCEEIVGAVALGSIGRGANTEETGFLRGPLNCDHCGNCIEVCPVGSLMSFPYRYKARPWDLEEIDTVCPYCGTGCHLTVGLRDGVFMRVRSKKDKGINKETLCVKGRFGLDFVTSDDRLKRPMVRKNNTLVPVSWRELSNYLQDRLSKIVDDKREIGGIASSRLTNEELYAFQKLMRVVFKTNNIDTSDGLTRPSMSSDGFYEAIARFISDTHTGRSLEDALKSDAIFVIGSNVTDENPVTDYMVRYSLSSYNSGAELYMISIRPSRLDTLSRGSIRYRPGEEGLIISCLLDGILRGTGKKQTLKKSFSNIDDVKASLDNATKDVLSDIEDDINQMVKKILAKERLCILVGSDMLRSPSPASSIEGLHNIVRVLKVLGKDVDVQMLFDLPNQRGAWDMGVMPTHLPGYKPLTDEVAREGFERLWEEKIPTGTGMNAGQMLEACQNGKLGCLYIVGEDPVLSYPDGSFVKEALSKLDLLIVQDAFLSATAEMADVVLPGSTFAEKEGTFTNNEGRVQRLRPFFRPLFESKTDLKLFNGVASIMDRELVSTSPAEVFEEIRNVIPSYGNTQIGLYDIDSEGVMTLPYDKEQNGSLHPLKIEGRKKRTGQGLLLATGNHLYYSGYLSERSKILNSLLKDPFVEMSEADATDRGISDGDEVVVASKKGEIRLKARVNASFNKGVVFIPANFKGLGLNQLLDRNEYPFTVDVKRV